MKINGNGYHEDLRQIKTDLGDIRQDLIRSLDRLVDSIDLLAQKFENWTVITQKHIPLKAVLWMLGILAISILGKEGVVELLKLYMQK